MKLKIMVSVGEVIDKLTILQIKNKKITDALKLELVREEIASLQDSLLSSGINDFQNEATELADVNLTLWNIEDEIRVKEKAGEFDEEFIALARSVYKQNDLRFAVKDRINQKFGSHIREVKSYEKYE